MSAAGYQIQRRYRNAEDGDTEWVTEYEVINAEEARAKLADMRSICDYDREWRALKLKILDW